MPFESVRAAEMLADAWWPSHAAMWRLGYGQGLHEGWLAGRDEERDRWNQIIGAYRARTSDPLQEKIEAARNAPIAACGDKDCNCSSCIRAAAVARNMAKWGTPDFPGRST